MGIPGKSGRIGVEESLWGKVRTRQKAKPMKPCCWSFDELRPLLKLSADRLPPPSPRSSEPGAPLYFLSSPKDPQEKSDELGIPPSGPPIAWVKREGPTPGCYACKQYSREGKINGKVHSKTCKQRYREWLENERQKKRKAEAPPSIPWKWSPL